jgi:hypothetical protein
MRRALQTAQLAFGREFDWQGLPFALLPEVQEVGLLPCDTGNTREQLTDAFPDFTTAIQQLPADWHRKEENAAGENVDKERELEVAGRVQRFHEWLLARPESVILVCIFCMRTMLFVNFTGSLCDILNCRHQWTCFVHFTGSLCDILKSKLLHDTTKVITHNGFLRHLLGSELWSKQGHTPDGFANGEIRRYTFFDRQLLATETLPLAAGSMDATSTTSQGNAISQGSLMSDRRDSAGIFVAEEPKTMERNSIKEEVQAVGYLD